jgi:hypothetical protein
MGEVKNLAHVLAVSMRIFSARFRPYVVDAAIIFLIQKDTWRLVQNPVVLVIDVQVFFCEYRRSYPEVPGYSVNIHIAENG